MKTIKINITDLPIKQDRVKSWNDTPIIDYCKKLIQNGEEPSSRLEVYRNSIEPDVIVKSIGLGARLRIKDCRFILE